ncbi:MAG: NADH-ubiquinone oxidoreductase-F iron-sulfur binding region domain-containing protein [Planctomycetota bacterium]|jgi:NADH:ubiquinone oxidoreductase subunit F (NADH-binding)/NADH:ubiquinone oxidoreductase subunit E
MRSVVHHTTHPAVDAILAEWRDQPAPVLPILHAVQETLGWMQPEALAAVAAGLGIEEAELYGVVTSYHFFRLKPGAPPTHICDGPACTLAGTDLGAEAMADACASAGGGAPAGGLACPGRCDRPVAAQIGDRFVSTLAAGEPYTGVSPAATGPFFLRHTGHADQPQFDAARGRGAYAQLEKFRGDPDGVLAILDASGLQGRGGAGFPAARKWGFVRGAAGDTKYVVVNADEGEPGTFKDRVLLEHDPHLLLEGVAIAAATVGADTAFIYLRYEYPEAFDILEQAIADAAPVLDGLAVHVRRGAGSYICGEETALLNSLEGKKPFPRERPPYPVTNGLFDRPTLVSNVETLSAVPRVLEAGAEAWVAAGTRGQPGSKLYSVSGDVRTPGNYELPLGTTVQELIDAAGGPRAGRSVIGFTLGGVSGGLLPAAALDLALDFHAPKAWGGMLGSGGIVVIDDARCPVSFVRLAMAFFRDESCGKCFPCRIGTMRLETRLESLAFGDIEDQAFEEIDELNLLMTKSSACGLGVAAPGVVQGLLQHYPAIVAAHRTGECAAGVCHGAPA